MANTLKFGNGEWYGKKDTILAYNDENSNYKPLPFNFSRASKATRVNKDGLIEEVGSGEPRIDYKDDSKGAFLLEPSRTNSILQSNQFDTTWITNTATIEGGKVGVGNSNDAWLLSRTGTNGRVYQTLSSSGTQTLSVYAKANTNNWLFLVIGSSETAYYDLENGVVGTASSSNIAKIEPIGSNGWYRCSLKFTHSNPQVRIQPALADNNVTGSGSIYIQNSQLEVGSYATSYIPTQGSAVTRLSDSCSQTVPNGVIGQTEGSIFSEFKSLDDVANIMLWMRNPSGGAYGDMIKLECGEDNRIRFEVRASNVTSCNLMSDVLSTNIYYKVAVAYKQNDFVMYLNGVQISVDTSGNVPTCSEMYIGKYIDGGVRMGDVKSLDLYNIRLSNSELQALTQV